MSVYPTMEIVYKLVPSNGSYICSCQLAYALQSDNQSCNGTTNIAKHINIVTILYSTDTNECTVNNGNCSQLCTNTNGSYICSCELGYFLDVNNHSCNGRFISNYTITIIHYNKKI